VIKRTGTLSLPLLLTCIVSMACSWSVPTTSGLSLPYRRHTRNVSTPLIFDGRVVGVQDGDTITVLDSSNQNHRIRLQGIDAPEKGQAFGTRSGQNLSQAVSNEIEDATEQLTRHGLYVTTVIAEGNPATEMLGQAEQDEYDLIVLGASGATDMKHRMLGSVSAKVTGQAPCSVAVVK
jgi:nucleotide-binding universal stress UspA family protein